MSKQPDKKEQQGGPVPQEVRDRGPEALKESPAARDVPEGSVTPPGNVDDATEIRTGDMGPRPGVPASAGSGPARPGPDAERIRAENRRLKDALKALEADEDDTAALSRENEELRRLIAARSRSAPAVGPAEALPGDGPVVWEGTIPDDRTVRPLKFRGPENEAEAREAYLTHLGVPAGQTPGSPPRVTRVEDADADEPKKKKGK